MKKLFAVLFKILACLCGAYLGMFLIYYFNVENKVIYYVIRPLLNKLYNSKKRDVKI